MQPTPEQIEAYRRDGFLVVEQWLDGEEVEAVRGHLDAMCRIAAGDQEAGPIAALPASERFHWLVAPSSTIIQPSPVHTGLSDDPAAELEHLLERLVR